MTLQPDARPISHLLGVVVLAAFLACCLAFWLLRPTATTVRSETERPTDHAVEPTQTPTPAARPQAVVPVAPPEPEPPAPRDPDHDYDQTYASDLRGVATAALYREDDLIRCFEAHYRAGGVLLDKMNVQLTLAGEGGKARPFVEIVNADEHMPTVEACITDIFEAAHFDAPPAGEFGMVWPVELPVDEWAAEVEAP